MKIKQTPMFYAACLVIVSYGFYVGSLTSPIYSIILPITGLLLFINLELLIMLAK